MNRGLLLIVLAAAGLLQGCATIVLVSDIGKSQGLTCSSRADRTTFAGLDAPRAFEVERVGVDVDSSQPVHAACEAREELYSSVTGTAGCSETKNEPDSITVWKVQGARIWIRQGATYSTLLSKKPDGLKPPPTPLRGQAIWIPEESAVRMETWSRSPGAPQLWVVGYTTQYGTWEPRRLYRQEADGLSSSMLTDEMTDGSECHGLPRPVEALALPMTLAVDVVTSPFQLLALCIYVCLGGGNMFQGYH